MDYTDEILKILSIELEPYVHPTGDVRCDGVLTSAMKINELVQQLLNKHDVSGRSELLPQLMAKREVLEELMKEKFPLPKKAIAERCNKVGNDIGSIVFKRQ